MVLKRKLLMFDCNSETNCMKSTQGNQTRRRKEIVTEVHPAYIFNVIHHPGI
jgi:hypothetical protein